MLALPLYPAGHLQRQATCWCCLLSSLTLVIAPPPTSRHLPPLWDSQKFCKIVDELLESQLSEVGISAEDFIEICSAHRGAASLNKSVFEYLCALEDFVSFKNMMAQRNRQLDLVALAEIAKLEQQRAAATATTATATATAPAVSQPASPATPAEDSDTPVETEMDPEMKAALAASLAEYERAKAAAELEMAEYERAIAASLELEKDRLKKLKALAAVEAAKAAAAAAAAAAKPASVDSKEAEPEDAPEPAASEHHDSKEAEVDGPVLTSAPDEDAAALLSASDATSVVTQQAAEAAAAAAAAAQPQAAAATADSKPGVVLPAMTTGSSSLPAVALGRGGAVGAGNLSSLAALPGVLENATENVKRAEEALQKHRDARAAMRAADAELSADEKLKQAMEERKAHMMKQRELLLARRKAQRDAEMAKYKEEHPAVAPDTGRVSAAVEAAKRDAATKRAAQAAAARSIGELAKRDFTTTSEASAGGAVSLDQRLAGAADARARAEASHSAALSQLRRG